ncbi:MAG TPA: alpha/beta fold hydrolase, partial [Saprospiraceae bacterium]|nr:alpha/beta fold hydrolase [Saprospiraceae bacterium]
TIARLMETDYQCILVDLRNHGRSPHDAEMNFSVMAEDVLELMKDLDLDDTILLGHSMGGKVAMHFATTYPELTEKLIVVDIAPKAYPPHHNSVIAAIEAIDPKILQSRDEAENILRKFLGNDESTVQFIMKNLSRNPEGGFEWKPNMPGIIAAYDQLMKEVTAMHPYLGPTLFIKGENSDYLTEADLPSIHTFFPEASLVSIPGAGHWVHADSPEPFTQAVLKFLKGKD